MRNKNKKPTITRMVECAWCSKPFRKSLYEINRTSINFCSYSCFRKGSFVQHKTTRNKIVLWDDFAEVYIVRKNGNIIKALIDLDDVEKVAQHKWYLLGKYVKSVKVGYLAYFILGTEVDKTEQIHLDHINRNPFDNRKSNLRIVPRIVNLRNRKKRRASESAQYNHANNPVINKIIKPEPPCIKCKGTGFLHAGGISYPCKCKGKPELPMEHFGYGHREDKPEKPLSEFHEIKEAADKFAKSKPHPTYDCNPEPPCRHKAGWDVGMKNPTCTKCGEDLSKPEPPCECGHTEEHHNFRYEFCDGDAVWKPTKGGGSRVVEWKCKCKQYKPKSAKEMRK